MATKWAHSSRTIWGVRWTGSCGAKADRRPRHACLVAGCGSDDSDRDETSSGPPRTWVGGTDRRGLSLLMTSRRTTSSDVRTIGAGIEGVPAPGEGAGNSTGILVETDM